jgi:hypothetical protein
MNLILARGCRFFFTFLLAAFLVSPVWATQEQWLAPRPDRFGLGLIGGDPEGWGITGEFWLDHWVAIQPALKLGWNGNLALECDTLWHNYHWIPAHRDTWPFFYGFGAAADNIGPAFGIRGILGVEYILEDLPGDFFIQLVPTCWWNSPGPRWRIYGEAGLRLYP